MRLPLAAVLACGALFATPALADCQRGAETAAEGQRVCQAGVVSVCSAQEWLPTTLTCLLGRSGPGQPLMTPMPAAGARPLLIHILTARYRAGAVGTDFVFSLRALCDGKADCVLPGDNRLLQGDPAPGQRGTFNIVYACTTGFDSDATRQVVFPKGTQQALNCRE